ncbi:YigZ family protein, partial [Cytobacillus oceanisediminis]|uniref:YigZ family protein n=1 Tax=Cytobacillus oceanisediminis TaxID=665099 RepID=UPI0021B510BC
MKKENWKGRDNCWGYMIGEKEEMEKGNDDGEGRGRGGVAIVEVLKKKDLKNSVVVITGYFGGIKLGGGGVIR